MYDSYRSSIDTIAVNCLVLRKSRFLYILATDKPTDRQTNRQTNELMDSTDALSRSRCRERRLYNVMINNTASLYQCVCWASGPIL